jgi:hypothetical protein
VHGKAKKDLHAIYEAESRADAEAAFDRFTGKYGAKYERAVTCLAKDRAVLLAFYDFPDESPSQPAGCAHFMDRIKGLSGICASSSSPNPPRVTGAGSTVPAASANSSTAASVAMARPLKTPSSKPLLDAHTPGLTIAPRACPSRFGNVCIAC